MHMCVQNRLGDLMSEFDNISSVEKWVMQRKINMNTTCLLQDDISIKEFLQINKNHKFNEKDIYILWKTQECR